MSFFSKISELFYDLFVTEPEEEEYIDSAGEHIESWQWDGADRP